MSPFSRKKVYGGEIFIFAVTLGWLPVAGYQPLARGVWEL